MRLPPPEDENEGPNLTPVIDIVFLLLIFFLVATQFSEEERPISIRLAEVLKSRPISIGSEDIVVNISSKGEYQIVKEKLTEKELMDTLETSTVNNPDNQRVEIRVDKDCKFKYPATVVGICIEKDLPYYFTVLEKAKK